MIHTNRILITFLLVVAATLIGACGGANSTTLGDVVDQAAQQGSTGSTAGAVDDAKATVSARSLRVRAEPAPDAEVIGGIKEGEVYDVIGLSSDGEWVQLAIPAIPGGEGWVSANFVSVEGAITGATITEAATAVRLPTPTSGPTAGTIPQIATAPGTAPGTATVTTEGLRLRVRAQPSAEAEIVGYVYSGEVYEVTGQTDDGLWTEIAGSTGTDNLNGGWVSTEYLVLH